MHSLGTIRRATAFLLTALLLLVASRASAQNMSGDAREVGLGGIDHAARIFSNEGGQGTGFVIPLGLVQMLVNREALRPGSEEFDPSMILEYAAVPVHYVIGRKPSDARSRFIGDIRQASLSPDLNTYRGFEPVATLEGGGILSPTWGRSFTLQQSPAHGTHRAYVGAGPYLSARTTALFDQRLVNVLGASSATYVPNSSLEIGNQSSGQAALQVTGGYRGDVGLGRALGGNGRLALEANYNYLQGFRYEDVALNLRLDTSGQGLLSTDPSRGAPLAIDRRFSSGGRGFSTDFAVSAIFERWRVSVRADGVGNRIDWKNVTRREYEMSRIVGSSSELHAIRTESAPDVRARLPVELRLQGAYLAGSWGGIAELEQGFQGTTASAALERRFAAVEFRGGGRYVDRIVLPSAGVSLRAGRTWLDLGAAMTTANIERQRNVVLASSIRFTFGGNAVTPIR